MAPNPSRAGFTLPEVLVAVAILALVMTMVFGVFGSLLTATRTGVETADNTQRERMALRAMADALAGASWYRQRGPGHFIAEQGAKGFSQLELVTRVPPGFWGERALGQSPLRRVRFIVEPTPEGGHQLVLQQEALLADTNSVTHIHRTVLLPQVTQFLINLRPHGADAQWQPVWDSTNALPRLARVELATREKQTPRAKEMAIYANATSHAAGTPGIGATTNVAGVVFGEGGFNLDKASSDGRLIFLIDKSGSMRGERLAVAKKALMNTLQQMEEGSKFYIYFFNREADAMPASAMLDASPDNINRMAEWLGTRDAQGGTDPIPALNGAFDHEPTEIWLLTDGQFHPKVMDTVNKLNPGKDIKVNTLGLGDEIRGRRGEALLMIIAKENGGTYTYVNPEANAPEPAPQK
ncbi:MAG: prepilin-type N-terminal cleavage/methylation domain-containing protein [Verrucomicrobiota bacterium]|nr:prepilin-type N-terminal cleavage/methylation domain-containing protein [Verrucomicrobiota bacterium]